MKEIQEWIIMETTTIWLIAVLKIVPPAPLRISQLIFNAQCVDQICDPQIYFYHLQLILPNLIL